MDASISVSHLAAARSSANPPLVIDVRRAAAYGDDEALIAGALRRNPDEIEAWAPRLPAPSCVSVYCVHGHEVSQGVARALQARGIAASYLEGGIEAWKHAGGRLMRKPKGAGMRWITRERPKIDRIACPWLVSRFIDAAAEFVYVPATEVIAEAERRSAIPYDVPAVEYGHVGDRCSFDAFVRIHALRDAALARLADIVRAADTARPDAAREAAGLLAVSHGLSALYRDDHEMLRHGMVVYDALYAWCGAGHDAKSAAPGMQR